MGQVLRWRRTSLRSAPVSSSAESVSRLASSGQAPSRGRAVSTVPSAESSLVRARDATSCDWLAGTPSTSARSAPDSPCRTVSSMISWSSRLSVASADETSSC
ncbi:MAG TPA: hypothetical protein VGH77_01850 [Streptosporangiaceae bacterium]